MMIVVRLREAAAIEAWIWDSECESGMGGKCQLFWLLVVVLLFLGSWIEDLPRADVASSRMRISGSRM